MTKRTHGGVAATCTVRCSVTPHRDPSAPTHHGRPPARHHTRETDPARSNVHLLRGIDEQALCSDDVTNAAQRAIPPRHLVRPRASTRTGAVAACLRRPTDFAPAYWTCHPSGQSEGAPTGQPGRFNSVFFLHRGEGDPALVMTAGASSSRRLVRSRLSRTTRGGGRPPVGSRGGVDEGQRLWVTPTKWSVHTVCEHKNGVPLANRDKEWDMECSPAISDRHPCWRPFLDRGDGARGGGGRRRHSTAAQHSRKPAPDGSRASPWKAVFHFNRHRLSPLSAPPLQTQTPRALNARRPLPRVTSHTGASAERKCPESPPAHPPPP